MRIHWLGLVVLVVLTPASLSADRLPRFAQTVWLNQDGSARVEVTATVPAEFQGPLRVPARVGTPTDLRAEPVGAPGALPDGSAAVQTPPPVWDPDRHQVVVALTPSSGERDVLVSFSVGSAGAASGGIRRFALVNTTDVTLAHTTFEVVLPQGYVFAKVEATAGSSGAASPVLTTRDGRHAVRLESAVEPLGGSLSVAFSMQPGPRRVVVPLLLILLSVGYLVRFRDLTYRRAS